MREINYSLTEYYTEYDIRWHGTFATREDAEAKQYQLIHSGEATGHLHIEAFHSDYSITANSVKEFHKFQFSLGGLKLT